MPNTQSAKKALRQSEARKVKNLSQKRNLRKTIKLYESLLGSGNPKEAKTQLDTTFKALDKAAKSGVIKKNKASRLKSRLSVRLNKLTGGAQAGDEASSAPTPTPTQPIPEGGVEPTAIDEGEDSLEAKSEA